MKIELLTDSEKCDARERAIAALQKAKQVEQELINSHKIRQTKLNKTTLVITSDKNLKRFQSYDNTIG